MLHRLWRLLRTHCCVYALRNPKPANCHKQEKTKDTSQRPGIFRERPGTFILHVILHVKVPSALHFGECVPLPVAWHVCRYHCALFHCALYHCALYHCALLCESVPLLLSSLPRSAAPRYPTRHGRDF